METNISENQRARLATALRESIVLTSENLQHLTNLYADMMGVGYFRPRKTIDIEKRLHELYSAEQYSSYSEVISIICDIDGRAEIRGFQSRIKVLQIVREEIFSEIKKLDSSSHLQITGIVEYYKKIGWNSLAECIRFDEEGFAYVCEWKWENGEAVENDDNRYYVRYSNSKSERCSNTVYYAENKYATDFHMAFSDEWENTNELKPGYWTKAACEYNNSKEYKRQSSSNQL